VSLLWDDDYRRRVSIGETAGDALRYVRIRLDVPLHSLFGGC
jgi:hypothetical protein